MNITKDHVVSIHYTLKDSSGKELESSFGDEPLVYLQGHKNIIPGLEEALEGKAKGDKVDVDIEPDKAYGNRNEQLVQAVPKNEFPDADNIQVGTHFEMDSPGGPVLLVVSEIQDDKIVLDGNHPMAGMKLSFNVEVMDIRKATDEEVAHRHVHGPGGHHH